MATQKDISQDIERLENLDILVKTYEEIAATHIRKIRSSVVQNRDFVEEIDKIFQELKASHTDEVLQMLKKKPKKGSISPSLTQHNGRTICVFLSANTGLYGDVVNKTFSLFTDYIQKNDVDILIIGKLGQTMFDSRHFGKKSIFFDFPDNGTDSEDLKKIITFLLKYEKILLFYGQFNSIVTQNAVIKDIYGDQASHNEMTTQKEHTDVLKYLFEPSLEKILAFFESQIFASILEQTINESQLAKNASRMKMLDTAILNIDSNIKKQEQQHRLNAHRLMNNKQLNALSGISLWSK